MSLNTVLCSGVIIKLVRAARHWLCSLASAAARCLCDVIGSLLLIPILLPLVPPLFRGFRGKRYTRFSFRRLPRGHEEIIFSILVLASFCHSCQLRQEGKIILQKKGVPRIRQVRPSPDWSLTISLPTAFFMLRRARPLPS